MKRHRLIIASLILLLCMLQPASAERSVVRILHVNDFHGFAEPYKPFGSDELLGGVASLAAEVERLRAGQPTLLLAAGDMIQGNNWANLSLGASVIELMNAMRFDAMALGNHEFDFGSEVLKKRIARAVFPVLGANVEGLYSVAPYIIRELGGVRIAIIGVVTEDVPVSTHPRNVIGLKFNPVADVVRKQVDLLKGEADLIIVLSHIGHAADRDLAQSVPGLAVIIGGHSHTKLTGPVLINGAAIVQAWEHGKALGLLDLTIEDGRLIKAEGRLLDIRPTGATDRTAAAIVEKYRLQVDAVMDETIGEALVDLDGEHVRQQETNLGDLIADIMRRTAGADAAIIGGGSIRTSIKKGEIKIKHVYSVSPFNNYLVGIRLTGQQIRGALEHGVSAIEEGAGRFPQVSGISFKYIRSAPAGSRVQEIMLGGAPLQPEKEYIVATDDFLAAGGDGYKAFGEAVRTSKDYEVVGGMMRGEKLAYSNSGKWVRDIVVEHIKASKKIGPAAGGRIVELSQ